MSNDILTKLRAQLAGASNTASAGWHDEGNAALLANLAMPDDGTGIPREYAAGSAEQDYKNAMRGDSADLERRFPANYKTGQAIGMVPGAALAATGLGAVGAGSVPVAGLLGGARGAVSGAGNAVEGSRIDGAARAAGPGALLAMAGEAAPMAFTKARDWLGSMPTPPAAQALAPAVASSAARQETRKMIPGGMQINRAEGMLPPKGSPSIMPTEELPRPGRLPSESAEAMDEFAALGDRLNHSGAMRKIKNSYGRTGEEIPEDVAARIKSGADDALPVRKDFETAKQKHGIQERKPMSKHQVEDESVSDTMATGAGDKDMATEVTPEPQMKTVPTRRKKAKDLLGDMPKDPKD